MGEENRPMNKAQRCLLHVRCMVAKSLKGRDSAWHWQHILREFGCGEYSGRENAEYNRKALSRPAFDQPPTQKAPCCI